MEEEDRAGGARGEEEGLNSWIETVCVNWARKHARGQTTGHSDVSVNDGVEVRPGNASSLCTCGALWLSNEFSSSQLVAGIEFAAAGLKCPSVFSHTPRGS